MIRYKLFKNIITWKPFHRLLVALLFTTVILYFTTFHNKKTRVSDGDIELNHPTDSPGEFGMPVYYDLSEQGLVDRAYKLYGFNQHVSDKISINRRLKDIRDPRCQIVKYTLPNVKVSIIIVLFEEGWSTLLRTVHSVINRTPQNFLHEIILVDDHSQMVHLHQELDQYAKSTSGLVKVVRMNEHAGLIIARNFGAEKATGEILVFLDSHCEVTKGWLQPLIKPIIDNYRAVTCPTIDGIEHNTFKYSRYGGDAGETPRGTFSWQFHYKERQMTPEMKLKRTSLVDNVESPVMAGGLFAISAKWFNELGKYDPGMFIWGGEQYELSFKLWMCGGVMYNVPCSRVGHVYRGPGLIRDDQGLNSRHPNSVWTNYKRVAEVWMDEFKHFLYARRPVIERIIIFDPGLEERKKIRNSLKCKSFRWYLENVVKDTLLTAYEPDRAWSVIRNVEADKCIYIGHKIKLAGCFMGTNLRWTWINEIREEEHCLDGVQGSLVWNWCHEKQGNQRFLYNETHSSIQFPADNKCLSYDNENFVILENCSPKNLRQKWKAEFKDLTIPEEWYVHALHQPRNP